MIIGVVLFLAAVVVFYVWPFIPWPVLALAFAPILMIVRRAAQTPHEDGDGWAEGLAEGDEWKPCASPQCRAPILRRSRKTYCGETCKRNARFLRERDEPSAQTDDIPF